MLNIFEQTLSKTISFEGIGLHTGEKSRIKIYLEKVARASFSKE